MMINVHRPGIVSVDNFFSVEECCEQIARAEEIGFREAAVRTGDGSQMMKDVRNNDRVVFDDEGLAKSLWPRVVPVLTNFEIEATPLCLNERFRYYRYDTEQQFRQHKDGIERIRGMTSHITFLVYLNDDFEGGKTNFITSERIDGVRHESRLSIVPKAGTALLFLHRQFHEGAQVAAGRKYVLRADVFYDA